MTTASNSSVLWIIPLLITICLLSLPAYAKYSGGTGEPNDPYQIATAEDLILLGESPEDYDKHFVLTADIDLDPNLPGRKVFERAIIASNVNDVTYSYWGEPLFDGTPFTGVFDGNGHIISHLAIKGGGYLGLFGQLDHLANVYNLGLNEVDVSGNAEYVGGLVGGNCFGSIISSYSTGSVSGSVWPGRLDSAFPYENGPGSICRRSYGRRDFRVWMQCHGWKRSKWWGEV